MTARRSIRHSCGMTAMAVALVAAVAGGPLGAQTLSNSFGGLTRNSDAPIDIESDTLTVFDAKKIATFKGNVKAVQGTTTLRAAELDVHYVGGADKLTGQGDAAPPPQPQADDRAGPSGINKIEARGDVVITSEDNQTTTSDWAVYDVTTQRVTVGGNVVLSQGQNVLKGNRLIIDLRTGESRFDNTGTAATGGGRIRALFMPDGGSAAGGAEPRSPKPGAQVQQAPGSSAGAGEQLPVVPTRR